MATKLVQLVFTEDEYNEVVQSAQEKGLTVTLYIKDAVLPNSEVTKYLKELIHRTQSYNSGQEFNVKAALALEWPQISKRVRLALGRAFYNYVKEKNLPGVKENGKDAQNVQLYKKI